MTDAWIIFAALAGAHALFVGGWWRYDVVALLALLKAVIAIVAVPMILWIWPLGL